MIRRHSLAALTLLCLLAVDGLAAAGQDDPGRARRRSRPQLPSPALTIYPKPLERQMPAVLPPVPAKPAPALPAPAPVTACDPNGCRDSAGTRYNGWGPGMIRSDGKLCQQVGNVMQCN